MRIDMRGSRGGFYEVWLQANSFPLQVFGPATQFFHSRSKGTGNVQLVMANLGDKRLCMLCDPEIALRCQQQTGAHRKTSRSNKQQLSTCQAGRRSLFRWI